MTSTEPGAALFADAMTLTPVHTDGDVHVFDGELTLDWTVGPPDVGPKVHGGTMLALCAAAARRALGGPAQPVAVSANYLWAPDPGPMRLVATVHKRGRRIGLVDVELRQGERTAVRAAVTLGPPEAEGAPLLSADPLGIAMPPVPPADVAPVGPGHPQQGIVRMARGCDIRPVVDSLWPGEAGAPPRIRMWVRPRGAAPDGLFALMCTDLSAPVTFHVGRMGWAPTVQLTAYLRALPADGWLRVVNSTTEIGRDWFHSDHTVLDETGRLVAQSRQLAMVPAT